MEGNFAKIIPFVLLLGVIALLTGTMAIINGEFGETMDQCFNSSFSINTAGDACTNSSAVGVSSGCCGRDGLNLSDQYFTKVQGQDAMTTIGEQQSTIAIIVVMTIIILALVGIIGIAGLRRLR